MGQFSRLYGFVHLQKWHFSSRWSFLYFCSSKEIQQVYVHPIYQWPPKVIIDNFVLGKLKRYVRYNSEEHNFSKIRYHFYNRLRNRGYYKKDLNHLFASVFYSHREALLKMKIHSNKLHSLCLSQETLEVHLFEEGERTFEEFEKAYLEGEEIFRNEVSIPPAISVAKITDADKGVCFVLLLHWNKFRGKKYVCVVCDFYRHSQMDSPVFSKEREEEDQNFDESSNQIFVSQR